MQQTLIEHTQMQRRMDEKTQAFRDQQVITLAGIKSQVDAIVSGLPNSKEAVTSLKQAAQYFREASEKLERLKGDPDITDIPRDLQDNRADFVESDRACGVLERLQRAIDVPEALDRTGYFTSTPAHETQLRDFGTGHKGDPMLDMSRSPGYSTPSVSWPGYGSRVLTIESVDGVNQLTQCNDERRLVRQLVSLDSITADAIINRTFADAPNFEDTRFLLEFEPSLKLKRTSKTRPKSKNGLTHPTIARIQGASVVKRRFTRTGISDEHQHSLWRAADIQGVRIPKVVDLCSEKDEKHAIGPTHVHEAVRSLQTCGRTSPNENSFIPINSRITEPVDVHSATPLDDYNQPMDCVREQSLAMTEDHSSGKVVTSDSPHTAKNSDSNSDSSRAIVTPDLVRQQRL